MNERIRELSKEAWAWAEQQEYTDPTKEFSDMLEQKFAELIVKECIDIVGAGGEFASRPKLVEKLQEHFGVEE